MGFDVPVAFFVYRRPEETAKVFNVIRQIQPATLLIVADGPKSDAEADLCHRSRQVTEQIDWECEVIRNYAFSNMGCKGRVSSGINWVFEQVEEAIIIEDDCVPDVSFFPYCEALLDKYRDDERVTTILGSSYWPLENDLRGDYYFSYFFPNMWGWASWRHKWQKIYDVTMPDWHEKRETDFLQDIWSDKILVEFWTHVFERTAAGDIDTWDYQWWYSCWVHKKLAVHPTQNLTTNIGHGPAATNTKRDKQTHFRSRGSLKPIFTTDQPVKHNHDFAYAIYESWERKAYKWHNRGDGFWKKWIKLLVNKIRKG